MFGFLNYGLTVAITSSSLISSNIIRINSRTCNLVDTNFLNYIKPLATRHTNGTTVTAGYSVRLICSWLNMKARTLYRWMNRSLLLLPSFLLIKKKNSEEFLLIKCSTPYYALSSADWNCYEWSLCYVTFNSSNAFKDRHSFTIRVPELSLDAIAAGRPSWSFRFRKSGSKGYIVLFKNFRSRLQSMRWNGEYGELMKFDKLMIKLICIKKLKLIKDEIDISWMKPIHWSIDVCIKFAHWKQHWCMERWD